MTPVLLALETSGAVASVAVAVDGVVVSRRCLTEQRRHSARLFMAVDDVMKEAELAPFELTGVVVGTGPGSFTGVRVAATAGKGIVHALRIPLFGVSSLLAGALAEEAPAGTWVGWPGVDEFAPAVNEDGHARERAVLFDARGDRLFYAAYRLGPKGVEVLEPPKFRHLSDVLDPGSPSSAPVCGSGALRHATALAAAGRVVLGAPAGVPSADGLLLHMASTDAPPPLEDPFGWEPDYLRATGAVRGRSP